MTDASKGDTAVPDSERRRRSSGARVKKGADAVRNRLASLVWLAAVVGALFLAVGALLMALQANEENPIVQFVTSGADYLDGPFHNLFDLDRKNVFDVKDALVNWGIAAVAYLVAGKILDRIIRP